jgi:hypothetical protein
MKRPKELRSFLKLKKFLKQLVVEYNIKLAGLLTGYELDVICEGDVAGATADEDDVELTEFLDEIEDWLSKNLQKNWFGYLAKKYFETRRRGFSKNRPRRGNDTRCNENIERRI